MNGSDFRPHPLVQLYCDDIRRHRTPRPDDPEDRAALVSSHYWLVLKVAREFRGRGMELEDLIGEGNLGLIRASRTYDPARGLAFRTWAGYQIRRAMSDAVYDQVGAIRVPGKVGMRAVRWLAANGDRPVPEPATLAAELGLRPEVVGPVYDAIMVKRIRHNSIGLKKTTMGYRKHEVDPDLLADDREADTPEDGRLPALRVAVRCLNPRQREAVTRRFGLDGREPQGHVAIGAAIGCTQDQSVSTLERAKKTIRRMLCPDPNSSSTPIRSSGRGRRPFVLSRFREMLASATDGA